MNLSAIKYMYHMTIYNNFMMLIEFKHIITNTIIHISIFVVSIATNNRTTSSFFFFVSISNFLLYLTIGNLWFRNDAIWCRFYFWHYMHTGQQKIISYTLSPNSLNKRNEKNSSSSKYIIALLLFPPKTINKCQQ